MAEKVEFEIEFEGADKAASELEQLKTRELELAEATSKAAAALREATTAEQRDEEQIKKLRLALVRARDEQTKASDATKKYTDDVKKAQKAQEDHEKHLRGRYSRAWDTLVGTLRGAGIALGAVTTVIGGASAALVAFGNEMERRASTYNRFNGSLANMRERTGGLVSDLEAMTVANRLAARGIQATADDLNNVLVAALETSAATGEDFEQVVQRLTEGLSSGARESLQQFNIQLDAGKTGSEATRQALEQLDARFGDVSSRADTAGGHIRQFRNALDNSTTAFTETIEQSGVLEQVFTDLFNAVSGGSGDFTNAMTSMEEAARRFGAATAEVIERVSSIVGQNVRGWSAVLQGALAAQSGDLSGAIDAYGEAADAFGAALGQGANIGANFGTEVNRRVQTSRESAAARRRNSRQQTEVTTGGGGGPTREDNLNEFWDRYNEAVASGLERERQHREEYQAAIDENAEAAKERQLEREREIQAERDFNAQKEREHYQELQELEQQRHESKLEKLEQEKRAAREANEQVRQQAEQTLGPVVNSITGALTDVIAGSKSAEEAFQGMLSSFLSMIAQRATLEAISEYAAAIASFASYQYDAGALHLAAGAAWTGVAIAAGVGAAVTAPAAASGPAEPQAGQGAPQGGGGGGTTVYNINGTIIGVAGENGRAEVGREIGALVAAGENRRGRRS